MTTTTTTGRTDMDLAAIWTAMTAAGAQVWVRRSHYGWADERIVKLGDSGMVLVSSEFGFEIEPASDRPTSETQEDYEAERAAYIARPDVAARRAKLAAETDDAILDADSSDV